MKKHVFGKVVCLFMSVAMAFGLAACDVEGETPSGDTTQYTVTFDLNGHGAPQPAAQKVDKGGYAKKPETDPSDSDYNFDGWYKEAAGTNEFKFAEEKIEKDTTVYAKWTAKSNGDAKYTVTFDLQGHGGTAPEAQKVDKGGHATRPATDPTDADYNFVDWYKEAAGTNVFNFATETIETNTTVYAKWTPKQDEHPVPSSPLDSSATVYVVGDSTVSAFNDDYYVPRYGYGTQLYNYLYCQEAQIVNLAISGRSSLSFITDKSGNYNTLKNSIKEGDYLIIGFGHNDEKYDDSARFTHPTPDYKTATTVDGKPSFQYTLYENYVKLAKEKGATPILCTPIVRYSSSGEYDGKSVAHVVSGYGDYAAAIKQLGADTETAVVDLTNLTKEYYKAHNNEAKYFHAYSTYASAIDKTPEGMDSTHINKYGAKMVAYWFATNLPASCPLAQHIKDGISAPTYEDDFPDAIKTSYVKPDYPGFTPSANASRKITTVGGVDWYHTAMGVLGGQSKIATDYSITNENDKLVIKAGTGSKFSAEDGDGFGAIFTQIAENKNFTVSVKAKATAEASGASDQAVFGIMLRDDIYVDKQVDKLMTNFASASISTKGKTHMHRDEKNVLTYDGTMAYSQNTEYEFTLTRLGQKISVTVKQGTNVVSTDVTDVSYVGVDNANLYVCLFASRGLTVQFTELSFSITGDSQGA